MASKFELIFVDLLYLLSTISCMNLDIRTSELEELLQNKCRNAVTIMQYMCPNSGGGLNSIAVFHVLSLHSWLDPTLSSWETLFLR